MRLRILESLLRNVLATNISLGGNEDGSALPGRDLSISINLEINVKSPPPLVADGNKPTRLLNMRERVE